MKIDCSIAENYIAVLRRKSDMETLVKFNYERTPKEMVNDLQAWSDTHPQKTYLEDLLEKYPNVELNVNGMPARIHPSSLGYKNLKQCDNANGIVDCKDCWNQIMEEQNA